MGKERKGKNLESCRIKENYVIGGLTISKTNNRDKLTEKCFSLFFSLIMALFVMGYTKLKFLIFLCLSGEDTDGDQRWMQKWWIYFGLVSLIAWSTLIPLSCFPHSIRGDYKNIIH